MNHDETTNQLYIAEEMTLLGQQQPENNAFVMANGHIVQMDDFEESYSGRELGGTSMKDIYCLKNDVQQLAKLPNWINIHVRLNAEMLDLAKCELVSYKRMINLQEGYLERKFEIITECKHQLEVSVQRFLSLSSPEIGAVKYKVKSVNFNGRITFTPTLDGDDKIVNGMIEEPEWNVLQSKTLLDVAHLWIQTRKTNLQVCQALTYDFTKNNSLLKTNPTKIEKQKVAGFSFGTDVKAGESVCAYKYVAHLNSLSHPYKELTECAHNRVMEAKESGWEVLFAQNKLAWMEFWKNYEQNRGSKNALTLQEIIAHYKTLQFI